MDRRPKIAAFFEPQVVDALVDALERPAHGRHGRMRASLGGGRGAEALSADLLRRRLRVEEWLAEVSGLFVWGPTKSHARRSVPLSPGLVAGIPAHLEGGDADPRALLSPARREGRCDIATSL